MVSVLQNTIEWNLLVIKSKDEILSASDNSDFYLKESDNNPMKRFSLTGNLVSNKNY